jgi:hypothetical protein
VKTGRSRSSKPLNIRQFQGPVRNCDKKEAKIY